MMILYLGMDFILKNDNRYFNIVCVVIYIWCL